MRQRCYPHVQKGREAEFYLVSERLCREAERLTREDRSVGREAEEYIRFREAERQRGRSSIGDQRGRGGTESILAEQRGREAERQRGREA